MPYYVVPAIEDEHSTHPDLPEGVAWVGQPHGGSYLVLTATPLDGHAPLDAEALDAECAARGLEVERVERWYAYKEETP